MSVYWAIFLWIYITAVARYSIESSPVEKSGFRITSEPMILAFGKETLWSEFLEGCHHPRVNNPCIYT